MKNKIPANTFLCQQRKRILKNYIFTRFTTTVAIFYRTAVSSTRIYTPTILAKKFTSVEEVDGFFLEKFYFYLN